MPAHDEIAKTLIKTLHKLGWTLGGSVAALLVGAPAVDAAEVLVNGGFETGDFSGWTAAESNPSSGSCDTSWVVGADGTATGCLGVADPAGTYAAYSSFDGDGPQTFSLSQNVAVPAVVTSAMLSWSDSFSAGYGGAPRTFTINIVGTTTDTVYSYDLPGSIFSPSFTTHSLDISAALSNFAGQTVAIEFLLTIPEFFSGPAGVGLDEVSLDLVVPDTTPPTLSITGPVATQNAAFTVDFDFSEDVVGFTQGDLVVGNASISNFAGSGDSYSATLTPTADGAVSVDVAIGTYEDAAGNDNVAASSYSVQADVSLPGIVVSGPAGPVNAPFTATFTFTESVSTFSLGDISVTNGAASNFAGAGATYSATITPAASGVVTVQVNAGAAQDGVGNLSQLSNLFSLVADLTAPVITTPGTINVAADAGQGAAIVTYSVTASDPGNGALTPTLTSGLASGASFPVGATTVTYSATDVAGNVSSASFDVIVSDGEDPVIVGLPANIIANTAPGLATAVVTWTPPTMADNMPGGTVTQTAGPAPGSTFPLGVTTITYEAEDGAGNIVTSNFTVTVLDAEPPAFTAFPGDIVIIVDYPTTSAVATWTPPNVVDNAPGATITRIAGPAPGAAFPLGETTVTYRVQDGAGNIVDRSFTVTVQQTAPGQVRLEINSGADGVFNFTSPESALNVAIATTNGEGGITIPLRPGVFSLAFATPAGFGLMNASCDDTDSTLDAAAHTGTINVDSNETITCTLDAVDSRTETSRLVGALMDARMALIMQNMPKADRRIDRLLGHDEAPSGVSGFGLSGLNGQMPFGLSLGPSQGNFTFSLAGLRAQQSAHRDNRRAQRARWGDGEYGDASSERALGAEPGGVAVAPGPEYPRGAYIAAEADVDSNVAGDQLDPVRQPFDVWVEGAFARFDTSLGDGDFYMLSAGADFIANPKLLLGVAAQFDWIDMSGPLPGSSITGAGFFAGPYVTARLSEQLFFDGQISIGRSFNDVSPFGIYEDEVEADRAYVSAALIGDFHNGAWTLRPEGRLTYFREETQAYVDSLSVAIPSLTAETGTLKFSPTVSYRYVLADKSTFEPRASLEGIWTFSQENTASSALGANRFLGEGVRGRIEVGFDFVSTRGAQFAASGFYDGVGEADFGSWGAQVRLSWSFSPPL